MLLNFDIYFLLIAAKKKKDEMNKLKPPRPFQKSCVTEKVNIKKDII